LGVLTAGFLVRLSSRTATIGPIFTQILPADFTGPRRIISTEVSTPRIKERVMKVPEQVSGCFRGGEAELVSLPFGCELYKFTSHPVSNPAGQVSPWWALVKPMDPRDPGLEGFKQRMERLGVGSQDFARARFAVSMGWNDLERLSRVRLLGSQPAWYGQCAAQPMFEAGAGPDNVMLLGGGWQVYIEGLTVGAIAVL
jgi:hypothetical protein